MDGHYLTKIADKGQGNLIELSSIQSYFSLLFSSISDTDFHIEKNRFSPKIKVLKQTITKVHFHGLCNIKKKHFKLSQRGS